MVEPGRQWVNGKLIRKPIYKKAKPVTENRDQVDEIMGNMSAAADNEAKASRPTKFPKNSPYYEA